MLRLLRRIVSLRRLKTLLAMTGGRGYLVAPLAFPVLIALAAMLGACQPAPTAVPPTPTVNVTAVRQAWQSSPHANTFDEGKGPNTYCARCHSPQNWDPAAKIDAPPNCVSCKFSFDPAPRIAKGNPPVAHADWKDVGCADCHATANGVVSSQIAWTDKVTGKSVQVASATLLCEKCHTDTDTIKHKIDLGTSAHKGFTCVSCHDPHSTVASCSTQACHPTNTPTFKAIAGHDDAHKNVSCEACHDASGAKIGTDKGTFVTLKSSELLGRTTTAPVPSHNLARAVDCARCHAAGNPWGLKPVEGKTP